MNILVIILNSEICDSNEIDRPNDVITEIL